MEAMDQEAHQLVELYQEIGGTEKLTQAISIYEQLQTQTSRMVLLLQCLSYVKLIPR